MAQKLPWLANDERDEVFVVEPFENGFRLSTLSLLYLLSYATGMLVRYFPSQWTKLMSRTTGDFAYPLIKAAYLLVDRAFPYLIINELQGEP